MIKASMGMYHGLHGNLRLWSVQKNVSRWFYILKTYMMKQQGKFVRLSNLNMSMFIHILSSRKTVHETDNEHKKKDA